MLLPLLATTYCLVPPPDVSVKPAVKAIDFAAVSREIKAEPEYVGKPQYGMFLFGEEGEHRVWAVLDKAKADAKGYSVLYLDVDADGVLGEEGERFDAKGKPSASEAKFDIGDFKQPDSKSIHTKFSVTWTDASVRYRMMWNGEQVTMGGFGPTRDTYASFGKSPKEATIMVPGFDRPLEFEQWASSTLSIGNTKDFKVFVGARGSKQGAFSCGDDKFLPKGEYVIATLIYKDTEGKERKLQTKLRERC